MQRLAARAWEPGPLSAPIAANAASTSATVSDGSAAGAGGRAAAPADADLALQQLAGQEGDRGADLVGRPRASRAAIASIFARRAGVAATACEVSTRSRRRTPGR